MGRPPLTEEQIATKTPAQLRKYLYMVEFQKKNKHRRKREPTVEKKRKPWWRMTGRWLKRPIEFNRMPMSNLKEWLRINAKTNGDIQQLASACGIKHIDFLAFLRGYRILNGRFILRLSKHTGIDAGTLLNDFENIEGERLLATLRVPIKQGP